MKCFLRMNSPEIRKKLEDNGISVCICTEFPNAEWLSHAGIPMPFQVHGVYPGNEEKEIGSEKIFGNKGNFKDLFLASNKDAVDCGTDVDLFISTINK